MGRRTSRTSDVAFQPDQRLCTGQASLIEDAVPGADRDEPGGLGRAFTTDHRPGTGLLGVEGFLVASCSFGRVRPCRLGFDNVVGDDGFRDLVIARVVEPTSLLDVDRVLAELGRTCASLSTRKRTLRRAHAGG